MSTSPAPLLSSLDLVHLPAAVVDGQLRVGAASPRLEAVLGLPAGLLVGRDLRAIYRDPADRVTLEFLLSRHAPPGEAPRDEEFHLPLASGGQLPVLMSASRISDAGHLLVTFTDISRLKENEAGMREHMSYISQLSDTALEQALALKRQNTQTEATANELRNEAQRLEDEAVKLQVHSQELETVNRELERRVAERTAEIKQANLDAIYMLAVASEAKDHDTSAHVRRVRDLAEQTARALGFSDREAYDVGLAAVLHDVGKIHVPDAILTKPGPLTAEERETMQQHTLWGQRILPDRPFFRRARMIARSHHENLDGTGYPDNLAADAIPIEARIVHVVDVYDALTSPRVYKKAWSIDAALGELASKEGRHFDPKVTEALKAALTANM
jgi:PAS domain S-box-containing protein